MFSQEMRCVYEKNPLAEVICQLRFPEILTVESQLPATFQELIRNVFPKYSVRRENVSPQQQTNNYQFVTEDGAWRVNLTSKFISLSCVHYTDWESFAAMLDKPLAAFIQVYQPAYFERIGLRYLNFISRADLQLEGVPYSQLIKPRYLGVLADEDVAENSISRCTVDVDMAIRGGCRAKIHAGPGKVTRAGKDDPEAKFVFDLDLYMPGNVPVNVSAGALQTLHSQSYGIFRGAITDTLHDAMQPV